ncbi:MAG: universal stress protein [Betaproteobacteria bacterium]|nr:universal stress protein [Betaproteobacteria bacterium]NBT75391.1 universal stress protein [Betaproteobacteria bacterium]NBY14342.1 universal stress protein [Betaproteobacteria bacterium]NCA15951.1 universal stress protein [Betaproteobacteria bacterium]
MHIAIAIDGSAHALKALTKAIALAKGMKEMPRLTLVNVHLTTLVSPVARGIDQHQVEAYMDQIAEEELKDAKALLEKEGIKAPAVKAHGEIVPALLDFIHHSHVDMIVVGGKGRGSLVDLLLGSVAGRLAETSPVPVLVVR